MKKLLFIVFIFLFNLQNFLCQELENKQTTNFITQHVEKKYPAYDFSSFIYVGIENQKLILINDGEIIKSYDISTSKQGTGNKNNSSKTPMGLHKIKSKYGEGVPIGGVFDHRKFNGNIAEINMDTISTSKDIICTRIIRIRGLENGVNKGEGVDSYLRKIYIHGTNEEGLIGQEASHGCIRMKNSDIVDLFDRVKKDMLIVLLDSL
jgi:hypothetical protein